MFGLKELEHLTQYLQLQRTKSHFHTLIKSCKFELEIEEEDPNYGEPEARDLVIWPSGCDGAVEFVEVILDMLITSEMENRRN